MGISIEYYTEGATVTFSGDITATDILDANKTLLEHPDFPNHKFAIWNYQAVENLSYEKGQVQSLATQDRMDSWKNPDRKVAVVSKAPLLFGLGRMYAAHYGAGPWDIKIFYDFDKAKKWVES